MSVASPKTRDELRQYIFTKLGAPVLQVNVAEEQIDIAINDAFQYWNERSHAYGTERMYLTTQLTPQFVANFVTKEVTYVDQVGGPNTYEAGMVATITLVSAGAGYNPTGVPLTNAATTGGTGTGLTLAVGEARTTTQGLVTATVMDCGKGYTVGDTVTVVGGTPGNQSTWEISTIKDSSPLFGKAAIESQNNYLVMPDNVVGVTKVVQTGGGMDLAGIFPGGSLFPVMLGGMLGDDQSCSGMGFTLTSYMAMMEYMATMQFFFNPPIQYDFNPRTHRLFIDSNNFKGNDDAVTGGGRYVCFECMVAPDPDVWPDCYNDMWLKEYATALVKAQWGRNLTKYNQVQMPGGITLNGQQILTDAQTEVKELRDRFAMDWADPPLDMVG